MLHHALLYQASFRRIFLKTCLFKDIASNRPLYLNIDNGFCILFIIHSLSVFAIPSFAFLVLEKRKKFVLLDFLTYPLHTYVVHLLCTYICILSGLITFSLVFVNLKLRVLRLRQ